MGYSKGSLKVVPVTATEILENPSRKGKFKVVQSNGDQVNSDFDDEQSAEKYIEEITSPPHKHKIEPDPEEPEDDSPEPSPGR